MADIDKIAEIWVSQGRDIKDLTGRIRKIPEKNRDAYLTELSSMLGVSASKPTQEELRKQDHGFLGNFARGAVGGISEASAVLGGLVGGAGGTAVAPGAGTVGGGIAGAALGGAAGQVIERGLQKTLWPNEYGATQGVVKESVSGLSEAAKGAIQGTQLEMGGKAAEPIIAPVLAAGGKAIAKTSEIVADAAKPVFEAGAKAFNKAAKYFSKSVLPKEGEAATKAVQKAYGKLSSTSSVEDIPQLLLDEGVTSSPKTQPMLYKKTKYVVDKFGKKLEDTWAKIDEVATSKPTNSAVFDAYKSELASEGLTVGETKKALRLFRDSTLEANKSADSTFGYTEMWRMARKMSEWTPETASVALKSSIVMRKVAQNFAEKSGASELIPVMREASTTYNEMSVVRDLIRAKIQKNSGVISWILGKFQDLAPVGAAAALGGAPAAKAVGVATAVYGGLASTTAKTTLAASANLASKIMASVPKMGIYGKELARIMASKGANAMIARHAYLMLSNKKYLDLYSKLNQGENVQ